MSNQLTLELNIAPISAFDNFVAKDNEEALNALTNKVAERFIYLWGESGAGKSHLLQSWCNAANMRGESALYLDAAAENISEDARAVNYLAIDHLDKLSEDQQIALFSVYNSFKQQGLGRLLMAGTRPPMQMRLRNDLRTRLGWGLIFEIKTLTDDAKLEVLRSRARAKQISVNEDVFSYLIRHWSRDLPSLINIFQTLDNYSLATHRAITVPLLKSLLREYP